MKVTLLQQNLSSVLTRINRVVPSRPQIPVLQTVKITASPEGIELTATNIETTESAWLGAKVEKTGELCVSAKVFFEFIASLPPETVTLVLTEETLHVSCAGFEAELPVTQAAEFPPTPAFASKDTGSIDKELFSSSLSSVLFAAATDEGRPILTGVKVIEEEKQTVFVATDGYRLSLRRVPLLIKNLSEVVVPARALSEVVKLGAELKEEKNIRVGLSGDQQVGFGVGETTLFTRLLDGEYPNFEKIIPKSFTTRALIEKELMLKAVRSAAIFARDNANIIRLQMDNQKIVVSAAAVQTGKNSIEMEAKIDGDGGEIAFNSRFLIDFLTNFPEDEFIFEMTGSLNSGVFKPAKEDSYLHIIMPVRVSSG